MFSENESQYLKSYLTLKCKSALSNSCWNFLSSCVYLKVKALFLKILHNPHLLTYLQICVIISFHFTKLVGYVIKSVLEEEE